MRAKKLNLFILTQAHTPFPLSPPPPPPRAAPPPKKINPSFYHYPPDRKNYQSPILSICPEECFLKIWFFLRRGGREEGENYKVEKISKIKPTKILVISFYWSQALFFAISRVSFLSFTKQINFCGTNYGLSSKIT